VDVHGDEPIFLNDRYVGFVTSGGYGHTVGKSIAMGYVDSDAVVKDGDYRLDILDGSFRARLQEQPLYDPSGGRMRA
jgi:dimethylglycine dehydrogenase